MVKKSAFKTLLYGFYPIGGATVDGGPASFEVVHVHRPGAKETLSYGWGFF